MTKISTDPPAFRVRPAQPEEAGAFFAQTPEQNAQMGAIGCVRMDFGKRGTAFWHTWHPRGREELNSPEFKAELQQVVDTLRETVLKDLSSMRHFCYENGGKIPGGWSQNYGYVVETEHYEYCLRCNPVPGDYQAYLSCYDLNEQKINHAYQPLIGRVHFINGDAQQFTDAKEYLDCIRKELPHVATTGFRFRTITQDPAVRKAVDDMKQATIQITFEEEKLRALRRYIAKRDSTLEAELQKAAQRLYEEVVPAAVQEYISDCEQDEPVRKPQKKPEVSR